MSRGFHLIASVPVKWSRMLQAHKVKLCRNVPNHKNKKAKKHNKREYVMVVIWYLLSVYHYYANSTLYCPMKAVVTNRPIAIGLPLVGCYHCINLPRNWCRHDTDILFPLLNISVGNPPLTSVFPAQRAGNEGLWSFLYFSLGKF